MYKVISLLVLCLCAYSSAKYYDCGSEVGSISQITVSNCSGEAEHCVLKRGTFGTITIDFTIKKPVYTVTAAVSAELYGSQMVLPFLNWNVCTDPKSGITCPLSGRNFRYTYTQLIEDYYPVMSTNGRWKLLDQNMRNIVCVQVGVKIQ